MLEGFSYTEPDESGVPILVEGDQLIFRPRRFGFFNLKFVNEVLIVDVKYKTDISSIDQYGLNPFSFVKNIVQIYAGSSANKDSASHQILNHATQKTIERFDLEVVNEDVQSLRVFAQTVSLDSNSNTPVYQNVTISGIGTDKK